MKSWNTNNPARIVKIWIGLLGPIKRDLIKCLKTNIDLFTTFLDDMLNIYLSVTFHHLNIDLSIRTRSKGEKNNPSKRPRSLEAWFKGYAELNSFTN